jgi:hypothetical protein
LRPRKKTFRNFRKFVFRNAGAVVLDDDAAVLGSVSQFIVSDHPVALINAFPYGELGLASHGILVFLPISPEIMIALHCPTIIKRYELAEQADLEADRRERMSGIETA